MQAEQMSHAGMAAYTEEEAGLLARNEKPHDSRVSIPKSKIWSALKWTAWVVLVNPAAGILLGTIGYFLFGVLFAINEGRMHFYNGYSFNTLPAFIASTVVLYLSLKAADDDVKSPALWGFLAMPIFLLTTLSMYVISIVALPSLIVVGMAVFFGPPGAEFGLIGLLGLMLPMGYLWMLRRFGIIGAG